MWLLINTTSVFLLYEQQSDIIEEEEEKEESRAEPLSRWNHRLKRRMAQVKFVSQCVFVCACFNQVFVCSWMQRWRR